jgi:hypothetical protein
MTSHCGELCGLHVFAHVEEVECTRTVEEGCDGCIWLIKEEVDL